MVSTANNTVLLLEFGPQVLTSYRQMFKAYYSHPLSFGAKAQLYVVQ